MIGSYRGLVVLLGVLFLPGAAYAKLNIPIRRAEVEHRSVPPTAFAESLASAQRPKLILAQQTGDTMWVTDIWIINGQEVWVYIELKKGSDGGWHWTGE